MFEMVLNSLSEKLLGNSLDKTINVIPEVFKGEFKFNCFIKEGYISPGL